MTNQGNKQTYGKARKTADYAKKQNQLDEKKMQQKLKRVEEKYTKKNK